MEQAPNLDTNEGLPEEVLTTPEEDILSTESTDEEEDSAEDDLPMAA